MQVVEETEKGERGKGRLSSSSPIIYCSEHCSWQVLRLLAGISPQRFIAISLTMPFMRPLLCRASRDEGRRYKLFLRVSTLFFFFSSAMML